MDDGGALCLSCGFCCDGTLFRALALSDVELAWAKRVHLPVVVHEGREEVPQPCAALAGDGRCTHYDARPTCCRSFVCKLLAARRAREVTAAEAAADVARVRELAPRVRASGAATTEPEAMLDAFELGHLVRTRFSAA